MCTLFQFKENKLRIKNKNIAPFANINKIQASIEPFLLFRNKIITNTLRTNHSKGKNKYANLVGSLSTPAKNIM